MQHLPILDIKLLGMNGIRRKITQAVSSKRETLISQPNHSYPNITLNY